MDYMKENAAMRAREIIIQSWTFDRLTPSEAIHWMDFINAVELKGTAKQRYEQTMTLYRAFLAGCGYDGPDWRETDENNTPKF